ncbi:MAG: Mur ligase family protein [Oscillibacter sp.]
MRYEEALGYLAQTAMMGNRPGLRRMRELLTKLGNPQQQLKFVHIAGTNGKGSTAAMLAAVLRQAGYRTGLYTSPHLLRYEERFQIDGREVSQADFTAATARVKAEADTMEDGPTQFELLTCVALCIFQAAHCAIVVLEVGLGGRLDATNVISVPEVAVITRIGLEHTEILGDTVEEIAA